MKIQGVAVTAVYLSLFGITKIQGVTDYIILRIISFLPTVN